MGLLESIRTFMSPVPLEQRDTSPAPTMAQQLAALRSKPRPWRAPSITEALGVPAIQRAVTLISNTTGSLSIGTYRKDVELPDTPTVITRPDPYATPDEFYRDLAYYLATRGEYVLWIAGRNSANQPTALVVVPAPELNVEHNTRNRLFPIYTWGPRDGNLQRGTRFGPANPAGEFIHVTYLREPGALRGIGPLQMAGAASSVSVEAQEWAANFYASGGYPSILLRSAVQLTEDEAGALKAQWVGTPSNMPRITDPGIEEVKEINVNPQGAQMLDSREHQNGEAARMFGIPGSLMEYGSPGSSLTYQNLSEVWTQFVRGCLTPNYLVKIEQSLSDILPRGTRVEFDVDGLLRADIKTRYEVYASGIAAGVIDPEYAQRAEGIPPGTIEKPEPAAAPEPVPVAAPLDVEDTSPEEEVPQSRSLAVRCDGAWRRRDGSEVPCGKLLAERGPFIGTCSRCRTVHEAPPAVVSPVEMAIIAFMSREQPAPVITVNLPETPVAPPPGATVTRLEYDEAGRIVGIAEAS
jgi:HK97 family phage portal protein